MLGRPIIDLTEQRFGRLVVLKQDSRSRKGEVVWLCLCDCGKTTTAIGTQLRRGAKLSCGCYANDVKLLKGSKRTRHPLYRRWKRIIKCCTDPNYVDYYLYGARGISVCDKWKLSFQSFVEDVGLPPSKTHTLDRIDNNGNYEPCNIRWATPTEQQGNKRNSRLLTFNGQTHHLLEWSRITGINDSTLLGRLGRGWSVEKTLSTKPRTATIVVKDH